MTLSATEQGRFRAIVSVLIPPDRFFFFFQAEDGIRYSECDWSSDVCSSDPRRSSDLRQKTAYELSEWDWSSDVCSSDRSEEHTSELQSHSEVSYAVFCLRSEERRVGKC